MKYDQTKKMLKLPECWYSSFPTSQERNTRGKGHGDKHKGTPPSKGPTYR